MERRQRRIFSYGSDGPNWKLSISDDGVGMPTDLTHVTPGLGSSIVEALARQLHAGVLVSPAKPGTTVSIQSDHLARAPTY